MLFEGNMQVLQNLRIKRDLLAKGDSRHEQFKTALAVGGGALRGTYGAGQLASLAEHGHTNTFDIALTTSTGTPATSFFVSGQIGGDRSVYWKECVTSRFLSLRRLIAKAIPGNDHLFAMDIDYLANVFRGENDRGIKLDVDALRRSRTAFYAAATTEHGEAELLDMRTTPDPIEAIKASIAIPGLSRGNVRIGENVYFDGEGGVPFPPATVLELFAPTDLLVLANRPKPKEGFGADEHIPSTFLKTLTEGARTAFETRRGRFEQGLNMLRTQKECRYAILWTDNEVGPFERSAEKLESASERAKAHLGNLLSEQALSLTV